MCYAFHVKDLCCRYRKRGGALHSYNKRLHHQLLSNSLFCFVVALKSVFAYYPPSLISMQICLTFTVKCILALHIHGVIVPWRETTNPNNLLKILPKKCEWNLFCTNGLWYWHRTKARHPKHICIQSVNKHPNIIFRWLSASDEKRGEEWNSKTNGLTPVHSIKLSISNIHALEYFHGCHEQVNNYL